MINLANFIESNTFIVVCVAVILISGIIVMIHISSKNKEKRRRKQNTKELNDTLSMEILDEQNSPVVILPEAKIEESVIEKEEPVVVIDNNANNKVDVVEALSKNQEEKLESKEIQEQTEQAQIIDEIKPIEEKQEEVNIEPEKEEITPIEIEKEEEKTKTYEIDEKENLVYAPIELNKEEAREVLDRLAIELAQKEEKEEQLVEDEKNIELTNFEREQEENAIISLDELMEKGKELYNQNEMVGYDDEGDEPITIEQLQERWQKEKEVINQIQVEEKLEEIEQVKEESNIIEPVHAEEPTINTTVIVPERIEIEEENKEKVIKKVEFPSILPNRKEAYESKFENSPIISPVYGIERKKFEEEEKLHPELIQAGSLELENTANYEKFDEEIKKTNEFIAALKELQKKLD
ncbi:MAG: hypothetical protein IK997_03150 [Bacilli bacterium]|nr:hypothetical protein [Bacilli bacterium]